MKIFIKRIIRDFLTLLGVLWLFAQLFDYFFSSYSNFLKNENIFWGVVTTSFLIAFVKNFPKRKISVKISGVDSKITLLRKNIPTRKVNLAFSSSNYFNTDLSIISTKSLLGQYIENNNLDISKVDDEIKKSLIGIPYEITFPKQGKNRSYPLGTISSFTHIDNCIFLLAITEILDDNNSKTSASSNHDYVETSLKNLWTDVRHTLDNQLLHIPLIGSGIGKSYQQSIESILFICLSYIKESKRKRINSGLNIYLRKEAFTKIEFEQLKSLLTLISH